MVVVEFLRAVGIANIALAIITYGGVADKEVDDASMRPFGLRVLKQ